MLELSPLDKTWILDIDGTLVKHNGHKIDGHDTLLEGVLDFFNKIGSNDKVILLTARKPEEIDNLKKILEASNIRYDYLLADMPVGERILVNDKKPSGLVMAYAVNKERDAALNLSYIIDKNL